MTDLHEIQRRLVERIAAAATGSALKFALMNAKADIERAIEAEAREAEMGKAA